MNTLRFSTLARSLRVLSQPFKGYPARSFFQRPASKVPSKNVFTRHRNYNVNPAPILLVSGVMSFLGLNNQEEEKEDELIMTLKRSVLLMQRGELSKAEQMLHLALRLAQERMSVEGITYTYDLMANLAMERGEYAKAEKLFVTVMQRLMSSGVQENDNKIIHMSIKLANIFADQFFDGKDPKQTAELLSKAHNGYNFCKERLQKKIDAGDMEDDTLLLLSLVFEGEGRLFAGQEMLSKARLSYGKALELSQKGSDTEERMSSLLCYLGAISAMQNETDVAQSYLEKSLVIARKNDLENLSSILVNLGMLKLFTGAFKEARMNCKEAFNLSHKQKDKDTEDKAVQCLDEINIALKNKK